MITHIKLQINPTPVNTLMLLKSGHEWVLTFHSKTSNVISYPWFTHRPICLIDWLFVWLFDWWMDMWIDGWIDWLVGWLVGWSVGVSYDRSVDWLIDLCFVVADKYRTENQTINILKAHHTGIKLGRIDIRGTNKTEVNTLASNTQHISWQDLYMWINQFRRSI